MYQFAKRPQTCVTMIMIAMLVANVQNTSAQDRKDDATALVRLGYEYRDGRNRRRDFKAAVKAFTQAAKQGNMEAVDNLGWLNEQGMGVPKNAIKARQLYLQASMKNHTVAQLNLARCLHAGIGGKIDHEEALKWNIAAFRLRKDTTTSRRLAGALSKVTSLKPHAKVLSELGESRNYRVLIGLARIYHEGLGGLAEDRKRAKVMFDKARNYGMPNQVLDAIQLDELAAEKGTKGECGFLATVHMDQGYNNCAPTSAAMALNYYREKPVDPYAIKRNSTGSGPPGTGTCWDHMMHGIKHVSGAQWEFRSYPKNDEGFQRGLPVLLAEIDARRPVLIDLGPHTVVLVGYDARAKIVYIQNPAYSYPGVHTVTYEKLKQRWHSPHHVSTTRGKSARPLLLTGDSEEKMNQ